MLRTIRGTLPLGFLGLVFAIILTFSGARYGYGNELDVADSIITPIRDSVYNHSLAEKDLLALCESSAAGIESSDYSESDMARIEALMNYYIGRYYQAIKTTGEMAAYAGDLRANHLLSLRKYYTERDAALDFYRKARTAAERYLALSPGADSNSLYGEILGQMLFLGNAAQALSVGPKARKHVNAALNINPAHVKAQIQEASRLAYSPRQYGGNPDGARDAYRRILREGTPDREDLFNIYSGFAMAAFMEEQDTEAISWFREASLIYPGNVFISGMIYFLEQENQ